MQISLHSYPWDHGIIVDTYPEDHFLLMIKEVEDNWVKGLDKLHEDNSTIILKENNRLFSDTLKCIQSFNIHNFYKKISPRFKEKRIIPEGKRLVEVNSLGISTNYPHDIHHETKTKIISLITYLSPTMSSGTHLYSNKSSKSLKKVIEWKTNKTFFFFGIDNKTWHSYTALDSTPRITLSRFLEIR